LLLRIQIYIKKRRVQLFFENNPVRDLAAKGASSRIASFQALRIIGNQCPATLYPLSELQVFIPAIQTVGRGWRGIWSLAALRRTAAKRQDA